MNGRTPLFSVFPMPEQSTDPNTLEPVGDARLQTPPFASLPPVTLAGVRPSVLVPGTHRGAAGGGPQGGPEGGPEGGKARRRPASEAGADRIRPSPCPLIALGSCPRG